MEREESREIRIAEGLLARDEQALRSLLDVYGPKVRGWLNSRFDPATADDALNRALDKVWAYASFRPGEGSLGGWFLRTAYHCALDVLRENRDQGDFLPLTFQPAVPAPPPPPAERTRALVEAVKRAIAALPAVQRQVLQWDLAHGGKAPARFVAERIGKSAEAVRAARCRGRAALRRALLAEGWFPPETGDEADE
jgi:RNA polymerase sigma factor (sigma-70 family)